MRRTLVEKMILGAVQERIAEPEHIAYVLQRVEEEITKLRSDLPDTLKLKEAKLSTEQRRLTNFVDFIGEGRSSEALAKALVETERRVETLTAEVDGLRRSREKVFRTPPVEWIKERPSNLQDVLRAAHGAVSSSAPEYPRADPDGAGNAGYRSAVLSGRNDPRCPLLNRNALLCGGRFEFFAKVETAGIEPASAVA